MITTQTDATSEAASEYVDFSKKLSLDASETNEQHNSGVATHAKFITPLDPVIETADGNRLPGVPVQEAHTLNTLKAKADSSVLWPGRADATDRNGEEKTKSRHCRPSNAPDAKFECENLNLDTPSLQTYPPLFPPLPLYGPPSLLRTMQYLVFRITSFYLSTAFLLVIVLGAVFTSIPKILHKIFLWCTFQNSDKRRPFYHEELRRAQSRKEEEKRWLQRKRRSQTRKDNGQHSTTPISTAPSKFERLEGGPDKLVCDARYYARRVGLDMEKLQVQTEDGFILDLWHVFDPSEQRPRSKEEISNQGPDLFHITKSEHEQTDEKRRYPVLLIHGLLQSAGAYCCNDDDSLAFYLHKAGYDVWLGNNRCGFNPQHTLLESSDPRMWAWNIRQMGVMDLPAFISRVLSETGFGKLGLVAHSQGTAETFVALAKGQRPDLGDKISVFCALAPAVYAGPLIGKMYFKFMKIISPGMFRLFFGIHAFIPLMMTMHSWLPAKLYGFLGYLVFSFMFDWSDKRWDRALRDRFFQFAPIYVSSESMRWWLGRECFAKHSCILSTQEDDSREMSQGLAHLDSTRDDSSEDGRTGKQAVGWYDEHVPPFALWVAGNDKLVDGKRLLRRFEDGREPFARVIHTKVIDEYEHLDVLWAMDSIEKVGSEVKQIIWDTMSNSDKQKCRPLPSDSNTADRC